MGHAGSLLIIIIIIIIDKIGQVKK